MKYLRISSISAMRSATREHTIPDSKRIPAISSQNQKQLPVLKITYLSAALHMSSFLIEKAFSDIVANML